LIIEDLRISEFVNPTPRQRECIQATDTHRFTLYGGGAGGGKSYLLRKWCVRQLIRRYAETGIYGLTAGLFSMDYPTLQDRQLSKIQADPKFAEFGQIRRTEKEGLCFFMKPDFGAGKIALRNLADPSSYKSAEFCDIAVEELSENKRDVFEDLVLFRLRISTENLPEGVVMRPPAFLAATNPTGIGMQWIKKLWVDRKFPPELEHLKDEFAYVPALVGDNKYLPPEYMQSLRGLPEKKRRALLEGDWTIPEGQYFTNFEASERKVHPSVIAQIVKPWWPRWIGQDWGFKHHSPILWHTVGDVMPEEAKLLGRNWETPRKCVFSYREHVVSLAEEKSSEIELGKQVAGYSSKEKIKRWFLSTDAFAKKTSQNTPAELLKEGAGSEFPQPTQADMSPGSRVAGWRFMYQLIQDDVWFISEMCPLLLDAIPALEYDADKGGEDIRKTDDISDDIGDCARYSLADMLNTKNKPYSVVMEERLAKVDDLTVKNMVYLQMEAKRKKAETWRRPSRSSGY
jgi:hypothetical protein